MKDEGATKGIVATTTFFTKDALLIANRNRWNLELKNYNDIINWIEKLNK